MGIRMDEDSAGDLFTWRELILKRDRISVIIIVSEKNVDPTKIAGEPTQRLAFGLFLF